MTTQRVNFGRNVWLPMSDISVIYPTQGDETDKVLLSMAFKHPGYEHKLVYDHKLEGYVVLSKPTI